jgi:hypothetical protein
MSTDKTVLAPPSIAVPATVPAVPAAAAAERTRAGGLNSWVLAAILLLVPLVAYWPTTFHDYGLRDDYSNLREAHQEPGKVLKFCASHARPIYGQLLQASYGLTTSVQNLQWMRFLAALLLGALSLVSFRSLRTFGWSFNSSLAFALLVVLVPSSQVIAAWAVGWPYAVAALLGVASFFAADGATPRNVASRRAVAQWCVALGLMVVTILIYQPSALFYVVPLAGAFIADRRRSPLQSARWIGVHLAFVAVAMGVAYGVMSLLYATGVFVKSGRIAFETDWAGKILWFLNEPLPNALSLFVLNDNNQRDHWLYLGCAGAAGLILILGAALEWRRHGRGRGLVWTGAMLGLPVFAFSVSLVASERYATYRTIFAMTAVLLLFLVASVKSLTENLQDGTRKLIATTVVVIAFIAAQYHPYALIATTQGNEWQLILEGAKKVRLGGSKPSIYAITSTPEDRSTATIYHDEFGSLSTNSEWVPREMFKRAMHDLHPELPNVDARYEFAEGAKLPSGKRFDLIIDLHRLRRYYVEN